MAILHISKNSSKQNNPFSENEEALKMITKWIRDHLWQIAVDKILLVITMNIHL